MAKARRAKSGRAFVVGADSGCIRGLRQKKAASTVGQKNAACLAKVSSRPDSDTAMTFETGGPAKAKVGGSAKREQFASPLLKQSRPNPEPLREARRRSRRRQRRVAGRVRKTRLRQEQLRNGPRNSRGEDEHGQGNTGGGYRNRTGLHGFAIRCVTSPPTRRLKVQGQIGETAVPCKPLLEPYVAARPLLASRSARRTKDRGNRRRCPRPRSPLVCLLQGRATQMAPRRTAAPTSPARCGCRSASAAGRSA